MLCACIFSLPSVACAEIDGYRRPPPDVVALLSAPKPPAVAVAPHGELAALFEPEVFAPLEVLARPEVSLYGRRLDPRNHARRSVVHYTGLALVDLATGEIRDVPFADGTRIGYPQWSPRGDGLAFPVFTPARVELWHAGTQDGVPARLIEAGLNLAAGRGFVWMPDGRRILCRLVPARSGSPSGLPLPARGPRVFETSGPRMPGAIAMANGVPRERALFEHFMRSRLALVDTRTGELSTIGDPGPYGDFTPSPDGRFVLVSRVAPPVAAGMPGAASPASTEVWRIDGQAMRAIFSWSDSESPARRNGRGIAWRHTAPATLVWIEEAAAGERIMAAPAPFEAEPREVFNSDHRVTGLEWIEQSDLAIVHEYDAGDRRATAWLVDFAATAAPPRRMWRRDIDDRYRDPGRPVTKRNAAGLEVVVRDRGSIFLSGRGATPRGERPFVSRWSLDAMRGEVFWRSRQGRYETAVAFLGDDDARLLVRHESPDAPPSYAVDDVRDGARRELTSFRFSAAESFRVTKEVITFPRSDGLTLQATLYLPEGRAEHERLPLVLWAYPRSYADADSAGQVSGSDDRFSVIDRAIPAFLAMHGFAVMDEISMPVLRAGNAADDAFSAQIAASAKAAIDAAVARGVADPERVGVAGHSYGAFMAVTLLAHTRLFKAGVALSGAYNRTLTPFGFQTERRTLWEAPGMYIEMSPFMYADRIEAPLLLVHGEQDENAGTAPMQSERLFQAIRRQGGTAKLVMLPHEGHVYRARESILHSAAEMLDWFALHLRRESRMANAAPTDGVARLDVSD